MSVTALAGLNVYRRSGFYAAMDSSGRPVVYGQSYQANSTTLDTTHKFVERYDPGSGAWTSLASGTYLRSEVYSSQSSDRVLQTLEYLNPDINNTIGAHGEIWTPGTNTWAAITTETLDANGRLSPVFWTDPASDVVYVAGGVSSGVKFTTWKYTGGVSGTWSTVSHPASGSGSPGFTGWQNSSAVGYMQTKFAKGVCFSAAGDAYVIGNLSTNPSQIYRYVHATDTWTRMTNAPSGIISQAAFAVVADQIFVNCNSSFNTNRRLLKYDIATDAWSTLAAPGLAANGAAFFYNTTTGLFYAFGGSTTDALIYQYDPVGDAWSSTGESMSNVRVFPGYLYDGVGYYIISGSTGAGNSTNNVDYYLPAGVTPPAPPVIAGNTFGAIVG